MPLNGSDVASKPSGTTAVSGATIESAKFNSVIDDIYSILNALRTVAKGFTGRSSLTSGKVLVGAGTAAVNLDKSAPTGDFVGTSDTQTLTNKTLTSPTINSPALGADSVDAITEIASALKTGADAKLVTGTAGTDGYVAKWNGDGDLVDGVALGSLAEVDHQVTDQSTYDGLSPTAGKLYFITE